MSLDPTMLQAFSAGTSQDSWRYLGAHRAGRKTAFAVWAPGVKSVRVAGEFDGWTLGERWLSPCGSSGVWYGAFSDVPDGALYKYVIETDDGRLLWKADPYAFSAELRPGTASRVTALTGYRWGDRAWMRARAKTDHFRGPMNIYELHPGSWRTRIDGGLFTWTEIAEQLIPYCLEMGYSHIELLPVMEHPLDASWGYQTTGYFAPTSRHGTPQQLMAFVDACHQAGIGVILDWVPGHFCRDSHGLGLFNGQMLYERYDHPQWGTYIFDFGRPEVRSFLLSSACYWLEVYHADGIRVDGVSSMLYLDFGRENDPLCPKNAHGGNENLEAIAFLQHLNQTVGQRFPGVFIAAEESSAWPMVTKPPEQGGLGFHYKWNMGWMNDTLKFCKTDFPYRPGCHNLLTFSMMYAYSENFMLALSHDEVVHGKGSLITKMPGDYWRQFAGLRLLCLYQMTHPGKKLNFMGNEFAQFIEWREYEGLQWFMLNYPAHQQHSDFVRDLNQLYLRSPALWEGDYDPEGFRWIDADNNGQNVLVYLRRSKKEELIVLLNFQPNSYEKFAIGVPEPGVYQEVFTTDLTEYGGNGICNPEPLETEPEPMHYLPQSLTLTLPPLGGVILRRLS